jgi:DNA-binding IclR family transcriptional regulator
MPHPYSSLKIIALLDHKLRTAAELAKILGTSRTTVLHQISNLLKWGQLEVVDAQTQQVKTGNVRLDGKPVITQIRTRLLGTTDRGRARLSRKGGHKEICPDCGKGGKPRE